jgi:hypothetical protein
VPGNVTEGLARGRIVASSEDVAVACIVEVFMAGVNRALDCDTRWSFAEGHFSFLSNGGFKRTSAEARPNSVLLTEGAHRCLIPAELVLSAVH